MRLEFCCFEPNCYHWFRKNIPCSVDKKPNVPMFVGINLWISDLHRSKISLLAGQKMLKAYVHQWKSPSFTAKAPMSSPGHWPGTGTSLPLWRDLAGRHLSLWNLSMPSRFMAARLQSPDTRIGSHFGSRFIYIYVYILLFVYIYIHTYIT